VCRNQSIDESNSELAKDLRVLIKGKIIDGLSDKEIYNYLSNRYGDYILLNPPFKTNTILLWLLPFLILISGCFVMFKFLKK
jgi:cytochrome c-type biogenesis protein CcmH